MVPWATLLAYAWPPGTTVVYVLVAALVASLVRQHRNVWRRATPFLALFLLTQAGMLCAGMLRWLFDYPTMGDELRKIFIVLEGVAVIGLTARTVFGVYLARFRPPRILEDVVLVVAYGVWGLVQLRHSGVDVMGVVATSAVITGVIAFAMQDTLGNVLGGLALQFDSSLKIGQWIRVDDVTGRVRQIRWRSTTVETLDWETVIIPNSFLVKSKFRILGRDEGAGPVWRRSVEFDADSDFPAESVIKAAEDAIQSAEISDLIALPQPCCLITGVGMGLGHYSLQYWISNLTALETVRSAVLRHLTVAMDRAAIRLYAPTLANVVVAGTERFHRSAADVVNEGRLHALRGMELFKSLSDAELESLVPHLTRAPFACGDVVLKQGATPRWLYLLTRGKVDLYVEDPDQPRQLIATLSAPSLLGEPGMVNEAPRTVSAIAKTYVECYRLDKEGFAAVLQAKPELTRVLAERIAALAALQASAARKSAADLKPHAPQDAGISLFGKVSRFFGLSPHTDGDS